MVARRLTVRLKVRREHGESVVVQKFRAAEHALAVRADAMEQKHRASTGTAAREPGVDQTSRTTREHDGARAELYRRRLDAME